MRKPRSPICTLAPVAPLLIVLATARAAGADGLAYRVADLRTSANTALDLHATGLGNLGAFALLGAEHAEFGFELWRTDGTAAGTTLVRNLAPGRHHALPQRFVPANGFSFFVGCTPEAGCELWRTDGTAPNTTLIADVRPGTRSSDSRPLALVQGQFFFVADDGEHGYELWRSDGTTAGTRLVEDIRAGAESGVDPYDPYERGFALGLAGRLLFRADDGIHGPELWRSDGTAGGTYLLKSLTPGANGGDPASFVRAGARLFFLGSDPAHGRELWTTDGSALGTRLVIDGLPGAASSQPYLVGGTPAGAFFGSSEVRRTELWISDGTEAGTRVLRDFAPGLPWEYSPGFALAGRLFFCASDPGHGSEPWVSDGTAAGTTLVGDLLPGPASGVGCDFGPGHDGVYVAAENGTTTSLDLWKTDGTPAGTTRVATLPEVGADSYWVTEYTPAGSATLFHYCQEDFMSFGCTLWGTDGTEAGTAPFLSDHNRAASHPRYLIARDSGVAFEAEADEFDSVAAYRSDGTEAGTRPLAGASSGGVSISSAARLPDGELLLNGFLRVEEGSELVRTDGEDVTLVRDIETGPTSSFPTWLTRVEDRVFFAAERSGIGRELWVSDGTAAGTFLVEDLHPAGSSFPEEIADVFGTAWFSTESTLAGGAELWESGGTAASTIAHPLFPGAETIRLTRLTPLDPARGSLLFVADNAALHRFDPVAGAANLVRTFADFNPTPVVPLGSRGYFFDLASDGVCALWSTDGTAAGTVRVRHVGGSPQEHCPVDAVRLGGRLFFTACGPLKGCELWTSDGTTAGTDRVLDLEPGPASSIPESLAAAGDRLYFQACRTATGCEPWVTDGSAAGTHLLADIAPGAASSSPAEFTESEGLVYFAADDGTGAELWAMPLEIFYDGFEGGGVERWGGTP